MTNTRKRLPEEVFWQVFAFVLQVAVAHKLLRGKTIAVDSTTLEANAAMKSLVRRATNEDWKTYVRRLMKAEGIDDPSDDEVRRFDRKRKKKTSNKEWTSATDPDSRVTKMKDGRTHLAYKAEHAVDLESQAIVATTVTFADRSDPQSAPVTLSLAEANLVLAGSKTALAEAVLDKGYHDNGLLAQWAERGVRTYIPERRQKSRRWTDKPAAYEAAFRANRRRVRGNKGRRLNRWRSERCERTFAHVCETGGGRRAWVRGQMSVSKTHTFKCAAYNLGLLLRKVWGMNKPRNAEAGAAALFFGLLALLTAIVVVTGRPTALTLLWWLGTSVLLVVSFGANRCTNFIRACREKSRSLTGC